jgi:hypothetical protein
MLKGVDMLADAVSVSLKEIQISLKILFEA